MRGQQRTTGAEPMPSQALRERRPVRARRRWLALAGLLAGVLASGGAANAQTGFDTNAPQRQLSDRERHCLRLEREMVTIRQLQSQGQESLPKLYAEQRQLERAFNKGQSDLERADCFEFFIFSRELRRTPRCLRIAQAHDETRRRLEAVNRDIESIRDARSGSADRRRQQLINELARNGCGQVYQQQARQVRQPSFNPFGALFGRDGGGFFGGGNDYYDNAPRTLAPETGILADATYRTMCVRLCDGYYFPVSFQTLPNRFGNDTEVCQSRCAAPAQLFVYRNPGGEVEQMISLDGRPYSELETAFVYRKQVVNGCSCSQALYDPEQVASTKIDTARSGSRTAARTNQSPAPNYVNPLGPGPVEPQSSDEAAAAPQGDEDTAPPTGVVTEELPSYGLDQQDPDSVTIVPLEPLEGTEETDVPVRPRAPGTAG